MPVCTFLLNPYNPEQNSWDTQMICLVSSLKSLKSTKLYKTGCLNNTLRGWGVYTVYAKKIWRVPTFFSQVCSKKGVGEPRMKWAPYLPPKKHVTGSKTNWLWKWAPYPLPDKLVTCSISNWLWKWAPYPPPNKVITCSISASCNCSLKLSE